MKIAFECWIAKNGYENKDLKVMWDIFSAMDEKDKYVLNKSDTPFIKKRFLAVLQIIKEIGTNDAINSCYHRPWRFYREHSVEQAVVIIITEKGAKR